MNSLAQGLVAYYDYLVLARAQLLDRVRQAAPAVYTQSFPFGRGSIRATLLHTAWVEWAYVEALRAGTVVRDEARSPPRRCRTSTRSRARGMRGGR